MRCLRASYDDENGTLGSQPLCSAESGRVQPGFLPFDRGWLRHHGADQTPRSRLERLLPAEPTVKRLRERGAASAMSMQRLCVRNQASRATWRTSLAQPPPRNCKSRHQRVDLHSSDSRQTAAKQAAVLRCQSILRWSYLEACWSSSAAVHGCSRTSSPCGMPSKCSSCSGTCQPRYRSWGSCSRASGRSGRMEAACACLAPTLAAHIASQKSEKCFSRLTAKLDAASSQPCASTLRMSRETSRHCRRTTT